MFLRNICTNLRLQLLAFAESIMSSPSLPDGIFLSPAASRHFDVDNWADYALRNDFYAISTSFAITKVTHSKATKHKGHEFLTGEMQDNTTTYILTDRGPAKPHILLNSYPYTVYPIQRQQFRGH